jgi:RecJ-like exonuclease
MKTTFLLLALLFSLTVFAQKHVPLSHGTVFGDKPDTTGVMDASKVEDFMDKKTRITVAIKGRVTKVTKTKGGWFQLDAGKGRIISAHFKNYGINVPVSLAGHTVVLDGVAAKQFIADDLQTFAGDTVNGKKQHKVNTDPKRRLTFEIKGMMVE